MVQQHDFDAIYRFMIRKEFLKKLSEPFYIA